MEMEMTDRIKWWPMITKSGIIYVSASLKQHLSAQLHQSLSCFTQDKNLKISNKLNRVSTDVLL
jgi:hypothetical protein